MKKTLILLSLLLYSSLTNFCIADTCEDLTNRGLYINLSGGTLFDNSRLNNFKTRPGFYIGSAAGYKFHNSISIEGEFSYQRHHFDRSYTEPFRLYSTKGYNNIFTCIANVFYDFDMINFPFKPYLGMGLGYARVQGKGNGKGYDFAWSTKCTTTIKQDVVACQAIAGISYPICQKTELSLEYRLFQANTFKNNKCGLALTRYF
jgi:opacity protein-like surface antigen